MNQRNIWVSLFWFILVLGLAISGSGQSKNQPAQPAQPSNQPGNLPEHTPINPSDSFLNQAIESNSAEVQLSRVAATKAQNSRVKDFANMLVKDHSAALEKLQRIQQGNRAGQAAVNVPLSAEHEKLKARLSGVSGGQFDREYIEAMVAAHRKSVGLFEKQIVPKNDTSNAEATSLARELLPTIKHHLEQAESIQNMLSSPAK